MGGLSIDGGELEYGECEFFVPVSNFGVVF